LAAIALWSYWPSGCYLVSLFPPLFAGLFERLFVA
jgi:hypothetical protein